VTVVIVNWNSRSFLETTLAAIKSFTSDDVAVIVVDNHSSDGSVVLRRTLPGLRWITMPANVGHELALDIGFLLSRTEYVVCLDVDAFPIQEGWLELLIDPLRRGYTVSGAHLRGGIVHPCCLAMHLERFVRADHTFLARRGQRLAVDASDKDAPGWDTGWRISLREDARFLFERTEVLGPGDIGSSWAGLVYHNFYSTRFGSKLAPSQEELDFGVSPCSARTAWDLAVRRYLVDPPLGRSEAHGPTT
jgi:glycosyltransferase involved in cell wall biosynthesis